MSRPAGALDSSRVWSALTARSSAKRNTGPNAAAQPYLDAGHPAAVTRAVYADRDNGHCPGRRFALEVLPDSASRTERPACRPERISENAREKFETPRRHPATRPPHTARSGIEPDPDVVRTGDRHPDGELRARIAIQDGIGPD